MSVKIHRSGLICCQSMTLVMTPDDLDPTDVGKRLDNGREPVLRMKGREQTEKVPESPSYAVLDQRG